MRRRCVLAWMSAAVLVLGTLGACGTGSSDSGSDAGAGTGGAPSDNRTFFRCTCQVECKGGDAGKSGMFTRCQEVMPTDATADEMAANTNWITTVMSNYCPNSDAFTLPACSGCTCEKLGSAQVDCGQCNCM